MASYFSNHSQSRFLANSTTPAQQNQPVSPAPRSRLPASKHFSTSVSTPSATERTNPTEKVLVNNGSSSNGTATPHPLRNTWVFWFRQQRAPGNKITNYEEGIKKIAAFGSVESYWSLWTHLSPPSALQPTTDYLLFHEGVRRPVWEDPLNLSGGKWIIRLKKGVSDRVWEDLVMAIIGDQFDGCRVQEDSGDETAGLGSWEDGSDPASGSDWPEICGCTISVRQSEDIVSLWNRTDGDIKVRDRIRDTIKKVLNLSPNTIMEYKSNNDSMQDKSSFRNSAIDRTPLS